MPRATNPERGEFKGRSVALARIIAPLREKFQKSDEPFGERPLRRTALSSAIRLRAGQ